MKNLIIIGDNDYARLRAHLPGHSVVLHDLSRGLPHDLYAAHIRLAETSEDFEVVFVRRDTEPTKFDHAVFALAAYYNRRLTVV